MDTIDALVTSNETAVKYVTTVQEQILEGLRTLAESLSKSAAASGLAPTEQAPAREIVEEAYSFNARLLEVNKSFAISVLDVLTPVSTPAKTAKKS